MLEVEDTEEVETVVVVMEDEDLDCLNLTELAYMGEDKSEMESNEEDGYPEFFLRLLPEWDWGEMMFGIEGVDWLWMDARRLSSNFLLEWVCQWRNPERTDSTPSTSCIHLSSLVDMCFCFRRILYTE